MKGNLARCIVGNLFTEGMKHGLMILNFFIKKICIFGSWYDFFIPHTSAVDIGFV